METSKVVETTVICNQNKFNLFVIIFFVVGTGLTTYSFFQTRSLSILLFGIFFIFGFPFIFKKLFRKGFSKRVSVSFSKDYFSVEFKDVETDSVFKTDIIRFDQVKLFKTYDSDKNDLSTLKLIFKDGTKLRYMFSGQANDDVCETDINVITRNAIAAFNSTRPSDERIQIQPTFFGTTFGLYFGISFTLILATVVVFQVIHKPNPLIISIGFVVIFFQIVSLRSLRKIAIKEKNGFS